MFEMTTQYEVINTITTRLNLPTYQAFTNTEGLLFLLDIQGKVHCYDPFGAKQLTELQDLSKD